MWHKTVTGIPVVMDAEEVGEAEITDEGDFVIRFNDVDALKMIVKALESGLLESVSLFPNATASLQDIED